MLGQGITLNKFTGQQLPEATLLFSHRIGIFPVLYEFKIIRIRTRSVLK